MAGSSMERMARYRERQRRCGLQPVELWVWGTSHPDVQAMLARNAAIMRTRAGSAEERAVVASSEDAVDELMGQVEAVKATARHRLLDAEPGSRTHGQGRRTTHLSGYPLQRICGSIQFQRFQASRFTYKW
jgi:hypothetical protein